MRRISGRAKTPPFIKKPRPLAWPPRAPHARGPSLQLVKPSFGARRSADAINAAYSFAPPLAPPPAFLAAASAAASARCRCSASAGRIFEQAGTGAARFAARISCVRLLSASSQRQRQYRRACLLREAVAMTIASDMAVARAARRENLRMSDFSPIFFFFSFSLKTLWALPRLTLTTW